MHVEEPQDGDADLIRRSAAGDREAFSELVARHGADVFRFARALASSEAAAEDALQEAFLSAWRGAASFRGDTSVRSWLLTIARNAVYRQHRRRIGEPETHEPLSELGLAAGWGAVEDPEAALLRKESHEQFARGLEALDESDREVLLLRDVEGLSGSEVAAILGVSIAAMKTRLHRARLRFVSKVRETYEPAR